MLAIFRPALAILALMTLLTGVAYPLAITGVAQVAMPVRANGSLIEQGGTVIGSVLIGQDFTSPGYFHPRPSAVGYDAASAGASNLGPTSAELLVTVEERAEAWRRETGESDVPLDAVTASASGLDPDISPENARVQAVRVAEARGAPRDEIVRIVEAATTGPWLGIFGPAHVNVLEANLAVDAAFPGGVE
ncbi:potassium-transporting ATPase subunit KdpC [Salipiger mucosus]|uniref:Potassium-transporting ATPase KdpC subunit n=1 Tax=Salipiger mucosus DSM 16094 TaxID=1123237 RepID=S9S0J4_9RHOB|nr:potassium-transporting ATPase subunit KdpC [Salipiger mucosus]EPX83750.1 Potassium-transporting ATPase C chain [Salipiger mucosus DSM 16094]